MKEHELQKSNLLSTISPLIGQTQHSTSIQQPISNIKMEGTKNVSSLEENISRPIPDRIAAERERQRQPEQERRHAEEDEPVSIRFLHKPIAILFFFDPDFFMHAVL